MSDEAQPPPWVVDWVDRFDAAPATDVDWPARFEAASRVAKTFPGTAGALRALAFQLQSLSSAFPDVVEAIGRELDPS